MTSLFTLLVAGAALAQPPGALVLHGGEDAREALDEVQRALGERAASVTLTEQPMENLLSGPPLVIGGGQALGCKSPSSAPYVPGADAAVITTRVADLNRLLADDLSKALMAGRSAANLLSCSRDPLDAELLRDVYFKLGAAAARQSNQVTTGQGDYVAEATTAFGVWRQLTPDDKDALTAVSGLTDLDGRAIAMSVVKRKVTSTYLRVVPEVQALWIDGVTHPPGDQVRLSVGDHLVQIKVASTGPVQSMWVKLTASGPAQLAVPELVPDDVLEWVEDPGRREDLTGLLGVLGSGEVYVVTEKGHVWHGEVGDAESWTMVVNQPERPRLHAVGRVTLWTGVGLVGASLGGVGVTCLVNRSHNEAEPAGQCGDPGDVGQEVTSVLTGLMLGGLGTAGVGLGITLTTQYGGSAQLGLRPVEGGAMASIEVPLGGRARPPR